MRMLRLAGCKSNHSLFFKTIFKVWLNRGSFSPLMYEAPAAAVFSTIKSEQA